MLTTKNYLQFRVDETEFEGSAAAGKALPGDIVLVESGVVVKIKERAPHKHIVGTLELASKVRYGMTSRNVPIYLFTPFAESYPPFFVGCSQKDVKQNVLAIIEFSHWDEGTCPRGNLVQVIGPVGDLATEELALAAHATPIRWKKFDEVLHEPGPTPFSSQGITFHIDPPGCRDIDDAITLHPLENGDLDVSIHIADVASWLLANPSLMMKASQICQTLYKDGIAVHPMFPSELSEDKFSLIPGTLRRVCTFSFKWNRQMKSMSNMEWKFNTVRLTQSFTYTSVKKSMFANDLEELCSGIAGKSITDSHEWIEQLMLLYNREAAKLLRANNVGVLRRHQGPDQSRFDAYSLLGLPADRLAMSAGEYCSASDKDIRHWGLVQEVYCHASSPIRRWADCINQLHLRSIILNESPFIPTNLPSDIATLNRRSKTLKSYERDIEFVRAILDPNKKDLEGIVAEAGRVWIPHWSRIIKTQTREITPGTHVKIKYFCDSTKRNWKRRMILHVES